MLQQTQVSRVINYYERFLRELPTVFELAQVDKTTLLGLWSGLGYNSRGLRLQQAAEKIVSELNWRFPDSLEWLLKLPGIGDYTAHAVMAFAFNADVPVIDVNIKRVLTVEFSLDPQSSHEYLKKISSLILPKGQSRDRHNALMDYGALVLTAEKTGVTFWAKQSKFLGSTRWVRSWIVKQLLKMKKISLSDVKKLFPHEKFDTVIEKMLKEKIVKLEDGELFL